MCVTRTGAQLIPWTHWSPQHCIILSSFFLFTRVKMLKEIPYTPEEAERAAGMGSYTITSTKPLLPVDQDEEMKNVETVEGLVT